MAVFEPRWEGNRLIGWRGIDFTELALVLRNARRDEPVGGSG